MFCTGSGNPNLKEYQYRIIGSKVTAIWRNFVSHTVPLLTFPLCREGWFAPTEMFVFGNKHMYPKYVKLKVIQTLKEIKKIEYSNFLPTFIPLP